jgi:hypothetical protein
LFSHMRSAEIGIDHHIAGCHCRKLNPASK